MTDELLRDLFVEFRHNARRSFVIIVILITALFVSNMAWLYAWNLPDSETYEEYELEGSDDSNVVYNSQGQVQIQDGK